MAKQNNGQNQSSTNLNQLTAEGLKWAEIQDRVNSGLSSYLDEMGKLNDLTKSLNTIKEKERKISDEIKSLANATTKEELERLKILKDRKAVLDYNYEAYKKEAKILKEALKDANKLSMTLGAAGAALGKGVWNLPKTFMKNMSALGDLFGMDKSIRVAARDMGLLSKGSDAFRKNIESTSLKTIGFGVGIKELAELQANYSELVGRNVMMNEGALESVAAMSKATQLGIEGASQMAADFDSQGLSAEKTAGFVQETLDSSSKMGLNATKVIKNISGNIKMLNRYRFKDGAKGLAEMAKTVTKLGVDMNFASGMADKLFDLEPAIEMSAQLQVLGGAWAKLADPFKLMYMARNDVKGLTEMIADAAKQSMSFAKDGSIETTAQEMHRLKIVAQQTGLEYDDLLEAGKKAFKLGKIKTQVSGVDEQTSEFIANMAEFKDGKATITIDGKSKLLSMLTSADKEAIKKQINEKKTMKERADAAQSFDEKITNLINMVKITMMPIVEELTKVLDPLVKDLMDPKGKFKKDLVELGKNIGEFVKYAAKGFKWFVETVVDTFGAKGLFYTYLFGSSVKWIANGFLLAQGFNLGTKGLGSMFKGIKNIFGKGATSTEGAATTVATEGTLATAGTTEGTLATAGTTAGMSFSTAAAAGLVGVAGVVGCIIGGRIYDALGGAKKKSDTWSNNWMKKIGRILATTGTGAAAGAGVGALFGGITAGPGAIIGGIGGLGKGIYDEVTNEGINDGIVKNGKITPIHRKDEILAAKPGGVIDNVLNNSNVGQSKIEFGDLNITGTIKIEIPGTKGIALEVANNSEFKSSIAKIVNSQIEKNINGGKNRG